MSNILLNHNTKSESFCHKAIKRLIFKYISENNKNIEEKSLEKYVSNRRSDVYFRLNSGVEIVVEVQNSKITVKEIVNRTEHYNKNGIHVLWILYGKGACVASPKFPEDKKDVKISMAENFLHRMYSGRVYYVNINFYKDKTTISAPFALHFSFSSKKKNRKIFRVKYESYYIKNVNYAKISSWAICFVNYNGFKLARFYDRSVKRILKSQIINYFKIIPKNYKSNMKLVKLIIKHFKQKYGISLILNALVELFKEKKIETDLRVIKKIQKKI